MMLLMIKAIRRGTRFNLNYFGAGLDNSDTHEATQYTFTNLTLSYFASWLDFKLFSAPGDSSIFLKMKNRTACVTQVSSPSQLSIPYVLELIYDL